MDNNIEIFCVTDKHFNFFNDIKYKFHTQEVLNNRMHNNNQQVVKEFEKIEKQTSKNTDQIVIIKQKLNPLEIFSQCAHIHVIQ